MDKWDVPASRPRLKGGNIPLCDIHSRTVLHQLGALYYFSQYRRTKTGAPFSEIKQSADHAKTFAESAINFLSSFIANRSDWCIITTPRRRHYDCFHFATEVCCQIAQRLGITFYPDAVQCVNRNRLTPEFFLLRGVDERNVIIYDDIITTGSTLTATAELFSDRDFVINLIGINNR